MAGRIQDSDVKDATEAGAASRLINDTKIYVTGSSLNKTLYQAITDGNLSGGGSGGLTVTATKTSGYTAAANELVVCNASGGGFTVTLPAASGNSGKKVGIKKIVTDTSFNQITIDGNGSETIDGALTRKLNTFGEYMELICDGSNWLTVLHRCSTPWTSYTPTIGATTTAPTSGTGVTVTAYWKRESATCKLKYTIYLPANPPGGTSGSGKYLFPTPSGITLNSTYPFDTSTTQLRQSCVGFGTFNQSSVANYSGCSIIAHSNSNLKFYINTQSFWGSDNIPWNPGGENYITFEASFGPTDWE